MHSISPTVFRALVILSTALAFIGPLLNPLFLPPLPIEHSELVLAKSEHIFLVLGILSLLLGIATTIGLCLFQHWSRPVSLFGIALAVVLYVMSAYFVDSGVKVATDWLSAVLGGAVLSMAYFSNIAARFGPNNSFKPKPLRGSA